MIEIFLFNFDSTFIQLISLFTNTEFRISKPNFFWCPFPASASQLLCNKVIFALIPAAWTLEKILWNVSLLPLQSSGS